LEDDVGRACLGEPWTRAGNTALGDTASMLVLATSVFACVDEGEPMEAWVVPRALGESLDRIPRVSADTGEC